MTSSTNAGAGNEVAASSLHSHHNETDPKQQPVSNDSPGESSTLAHADRPQPDRAKRFDDFWRRKHQRLISTMPTQFHWHFRRDQREELDLRRQHIQWLNAMYGGFEPTTEYDLADIIPFIDLTVAASRTAGHRTDRMWILIPVSAHRVWCRDVVTTPDANGWPTIAGVGVRADVSTEPPHEWLPGEPLTHFRDDAIVVWAKNLHTPVATRYLLPAGSSSTAQAIYSQLREDGWTRHDAEEAASLLDPGRRNDTPPSAPGGKS